MGLRPPDFHIAAHRGALLEQPENTIAAFAAAVALGADELELDVRLSADGVLVVHHDDTLVRTAGRTERVAELTWEELALCRMIGDEPICRLEEVLDRFPSTGLQIEIKDPAALEPVLALLAEAPGRVEQAYITCFDRAVLDAIPGILPSVRFGWILPRAARGRLAELDPALIPRVNAHWDLVDDPALAAYQAAGGLVSPWPCETPEEIRRAMGGPYCGLTTDRPELAVSVRAELEARCVAHA